MSKAILLKNTTIIDPKNETEFWGSVLIKNGLIADIIKEKTNLNIPNCEIIDCQNYILSPGLIDMWVFTGEPGFEHIETIEGISNAALKSGITSIASRPDTNPIIDEIELVEYIKSKSLEKSKVKFYPIAALTKKTLGENMTEIGSLIDAGAVGFSDAYKEIKNTKVLKNAFTYATNFDAQIIQVPISDLDQGGVMNESEMSMRLGLPGMISIAETIALERELRIAKHTGTKYHSMCISTKESLNAIMHYKNLTDSITSGISINNLILNENDIGAYRTFFKLRPPLRSEEDRFYLIDNLQSNNIDVITSSHDPQGTESKRLPFEEASFGATGIETLLSASLSLYHSGHISLPKLLKKLTYNPSKILKLEETGSMEIGKKADLILFDKDTPWILKADKLISKCKNTTFEDQKMQGKVLLTIIEGNIVFKSDF
ncbi:MAG: dihydroorotase [Alphaproteobacteria bacterium]